MSEFDIVGFCPMGCGNTLFRTGTGHIMCAKAGCSSPLAVSSILVAGETEHLVLIADGSINMQHPLRERLDGTLFGCTLFEEIGESGDLMPPGRYRVSRAQRGLFWEDLTAMEEGS